MDWKLAIRAPESSFEIAYGATQSNQRRARIPGLVRTGFCYEIEYYK